MEIMLASQHVLFKIINKDVSFWGLDPLDSILEEECYRAMDVLMWHFKKASFYVTHIEYDVEFKSIMDEVCNDMGI